eukprot:1402502-Lingulodinium_polyedra.AAC.1
MGGTPSGTRYSRGLSFHQARKARTASGRSARERQAAAARVHSLLFVLNASFASRPCSSRPEQR